MACGSPDSIDLMRGNFVGYRSIASSAYLQRIDTDPIFPSARAVTLAPSVFGLLNLPFVGFSLVYDGHSGRDKSSTFLRRGNESLSNYVYWQAVFQTPGRE